MKTTILTIEGMHCDGCAATIRALLEREAGVRKAEASYADRQARVLHDPNTTSDAELKAAIEKAGFRAAVQAAKADGRWAAAYAPSSQAEVPADLLAAIAADPAAQAMFDVLTKANRFALINGVNAVKRAQTRERKIGEFVAMLARHETIYPQKAKPPNSPSARQPTTRN